MGMTEVLRKGWLFSQNLVVTNQLDQLIVELNSSLRHIIVTLDYLITDFPPLDYFKERGHSQTMLTNILAFFDLLTTSC